MGERFWEQVIPLLWASVSLSVKEESDPKDPLGPFHLNTHLFFQAFLPLSLHTLHALLGSLTFWLTIAYARGCLAPNTQFVEHQTAS